LKTLLYTLQTTKDNQGNTPAFLLLMLSQEVSCTKPAAVSLLVGIDVFAGIVEPAHKAAADIAVTLCLHARAKAVADLLDTFVQERPRDLQCFAELNSPWRHRELRTVQGRCDDANFGRRGHEAWVELLGFHDFVSIGMF
jgi:hypothetical protein